MRVLIIILSIAAFVSTESLTNVEIEKIRPVGPVSSIYENLVYHMATVTDEIQMQLKKKVAKTESSILGNIEVVVATTMQKLTEPIFEANKTIINCLQSWTMAELLKRIDMQLSNCTEDLVNTIENFRIEADNISYNLQKFIEDIIILPEECQMLSDGDFTFASSSNCFLQKIASINENIAIQLNQASMTISHTQRLTEDGIEGAQLCANDLIEEVTKFLKKSLENC